MVTKVYSRTSKTDENKNIVSRVHGMKTDFRYSVDLVHIHFFTIPSTFIIFQFFFCCCWVDKKRQAMMELFSYFSFTQYLQLRVITSRQLRVAICLIVKKPLFFASRRVSSLFPFILPTRNIYFVFVVLMAHLKA
jgi:hypothetical protein